MLGSAVLGSFYLASATAQTPPASAPGTVRATQVVVEVFRGVAPRFTQLAVEVLDVTPLTVTPLTLPDAFTGVPYSQQLTATGPGLGPYAFAVIGGALPLGLTLSSSGLIAGLQPSTGPYIIMPATLPPAQVDIAYLQQLAMVEAGLPQTFTFTIRVTDTGSHKAVEVPYTLTLREGGTVTGWTFAFTPLPQCLHGDATGLISGRPMTVGSFPVTVTVTHPALPTAAQTYTLVVTS